MSSLLPLVFFSDENANDAILCATNIKKSPGDFKKLMMGKGLGLSVSMQDSQVLPTRQRKLQNFASACIKYRNFMITEHTLRMQKQIGNSFKQSLAASPNWTPSCLRQARRLYCASSLRNKYGKTIQISTSMIVDILVRWLVRSRPQKFSAQMPLCLRRKQRSLMAEIKVAIS